MSTAGESTEEIIDCRKRSSKCMVLQFSKNNSALDARIKEHVCPGLLPSIQRLLLLELPTDEDRELIADFFIDYAYHETRVLPQLQNALTL
jgi:hypothetical protein